MILDHGKSGRCGRDRRKARRLGNFYCHTHSSLPPFDRRSPPWYNLFFSFQPFPAVKSKMAPIIFTKKILSAADQHNRCHSDRNIENHFESLKFLLPETYSIVRKILSIHNLYAQVKQAKNLRSKITRNRC